ncbi:MAG: SOS response-associated peptidase [Terrimesophilobacter sp.]
MCGRFAMDKETDELIAEFVATEGTARLQDWRPSWNVAPTDPVPIVREHGGRREVDLVRWGLVPPTSPTFGGGKPIINARIETVATNGLFKGAFASRRCIVPARGYFEWQLQDGGKQPYFIHEPDADLAMAGLLGAWPDRTKTLDDPDRWRLSVAIITRDAHVAPGEVHDRMPACLSPDAYDEWFGDDLGTDDLLQLLDGSSFEVAHRLGYHAVSKAVNSVKNNGRELIDSL